MDEAAPNLGGSEVCFLSGKCTLMLHIKHK